MAFPVANGYGNLPNGNFSPIIYSKKVQKAFRNTSVVEDITNTDYSGEIANFGDSVKIIKEPEITINSYARGTTLATQALTDADFTMVVDQANYFQFAIDDIEEAHSHVNFMDLATDRAGYKLRDEFDREVLGYLAGWSWNGSVWARRSAVSGTKQTAAADVDELLAANKLDITDFGGSDIGGASEITSIPLAAGGGAGGITSPLQVLNRIARKMDQANVDTDGRWIAVDPVFAEILMDENSKLVSRDFGGGDELRNGRMPGTHPWLPRLQVEQPALPRRVAPTRLLSAGSETGLSAFVVAGHDSAVATAEQIAKTESFRSPDTFADIVRGMQLYGSKILRSEALFTAAVNLA
jgi:hypothetical protein